MAKTKRSIKTPQLPFTKSNYQLFAAGIAIIILGYIALAQGPAESFWSLTLAPILLVVGYCVVIPFAILYQKKSTADSAKS
jgi:hypothetical protein